MNVVQLFPPRPRPEISIFYCPFRQVWNVNHMSAYGDSAGILAAFQSMEEADAFARHEADRMRADYEGQPTGIEPSEAPQ